ncbi:DinB family protein [Streptomyces sp. NPDC001941]|uniref:DinB family protein n=1 Tax=Streptomyces sp. NPDC001941 TaxID=3154659 RepID=UPI003328DA20
MVALVPVEAHGDERGALVNFIRVQRAAVRRSLLGLTDEQAATRTTASELTLSGLLKHVAEVELNWLRLAQQRPNEKQREPGTWDEGFRLVGDETVAGVMEFWTSVAKQTDDFLATVPDLSDTFPLPEAPWFPKDGQVSMRWMALHLVQEMGRHAGHADILRESLDGKTSFELIGQESGESWG